MRLVFCLLLLVGIVTCGFGQTRSIVGRIVSAEDQRPIKNANILLLNKSQNTFSNHLGYFALDIIDEDSSILIISHIGFITSQVNVPESDNFRLRLKVEKIHIADFDMAVYESQELEPLVNASADTASLYTEEHALYSGGWEYFINGLGKTLERIDWKYLGESKSEVSFAIDENGKIINLSFDSLIRNNKKAIEDTLMSMPIWAPAKQRGEAVKQYFTFSIRCPETFTVIEDPANPEGGMTTFYKFVSEHLRYPKQARNIGVQGRVFVQFVIDSDGSITEVEVVKGLGYGLDEEAVRVISLSPKWKPGMQKGKPVKQRMVLPITFKLG